MTRRPRSATRVKVDTGLGTKVLSWVSAHWRALSGAAGLVVVAVLFVVGLRADATAGAALAPKVEELKRDLAETAEQLSGRLTTIEAVMPRLEGTVDAIYLHLLGTPTIAPRVEPPRREP